MEKFKIEHYERDNSENQFPWYRTLQSSTADNIKDTLSLKLGLKADSTSEKLVRVILENSKLLKVIRADSKNFSIAEILKSINIIPEKNVYLNWYRFDEIDEVHFEDLDKYFDDIWYPDSDDIDIFDQTFSWILTVLHNGSVKFIEVDK